MESTALQVKTSYSIRESLNKIPNLIKKAKELGYQSLAITDKNNMFGVPEFYQECKKNNIKPIIGIELTIEEKNILLYAINNFGYKNLIKLSTIKSERDITKDDLTNYKENLLLVIPYQNYDGDIYNIYEKKFIGYSTIEEREKILEKNKVLINNVSYLENEDHKYLDYLLMIKELKVLGEYELNTHKGNNLLSIEEIEQLSTIEDIENTKDIANICNVELKYTEGLLPIYDKKINEYEYLKYLCTKGLNRRLNNNVPEKYQKRLYFRENKVRAD